jgi:spore coat protein JB
MANTNSMVTINSENIINISDKDSLMKTGQQYGFALNDIVLFLDTHPNHKEALELYHKYRQLYAAATFEYSERFAPMFVNDNQSYDTWNWVNTPFPWE